MTRRMLAFAAMLALLPTVSACRDTPDAPTSHLSDRLPQVDVIAAPAADGAATLELIGSPPPGQSVPVGLDVAGRVASVLVSEGQMVQAGDVLATVAITSGAGSAPPSGGPDAGAASELRAAEADLDKLRPLYAKGFVTRPRFERAEARVNAARARMNSPRAMPSAPIITNITVTAPIAGVVSDVSVVSGSAVIVGAPMFTVDGSGGILRALTMDAAARRVTKGMKARILPASETGLAFDSEVAVVVEQPSGAQTAFALDLTLPPGTNLTGAVAKVTLALPDGGGKTLLIPASAADPLSSGLKPGSKDAAIMLYVIGPDKRPELVRMVLVGRQGEQLIVAGLLQPGALIVSDAARGKAMSGQQVAPRRIAFAPKPKRT